MIRVLITRTVMQSGPSSWFIYHFPASPYDTRSLCQRSYGTVIDFEELLHISAGHSIKLCRWCERLTPSTRSVETTKGGQ